MDRSDENTLIDLIERPSKTKANKKRCWREIEAIKEKYRLKRELDEYDLAFDSDYE